MGSILASDTVERAGILLTDEGFKAWTRSELIRWLNDGQRAIVAIRPDASYTIQTVLLAEGTQQSIPAGSLRILKVIRNMGEDGLTPGRAIRLNDMDEYDLENPAWHTSARADSVVRAYMVDERLPKNWWCYPAQPATNRGQVALATSESPADCTINGVNGGVSDSAITLDDVYDNALLAFMNYRAYMKDSQYAQPGGKGDLAFQEFTSLLGVKTESDKRFKSSSSAPPKWSPPPPGNSGAFSG